MTAIDTHNSGDAFLRSLPVRPVGGGDPAESEDESEMGSENGSGVVYGDG